MAGRYYADNYMVGGGSTSNINYFWIAYSTDGGSSFTNIKTATPSDRLVSWTIPNDVSSTQCRVRVSALDANRNILAYDVSDSNFTISDSEVSCDITNPSAFGLTIITHGHLSGTDDWVKEMAIAIANRFGGITKIPIYILKIYKDFTASTTLDENVPQGLNFKTAGGAIIKVDWSDLSRGVPDRDCIGWTPTWKVADAIFNNILYSWFRVPIHLIGHSRGSSVNSRLAGALGEKGIWVDQFTSLDPQPVTHCDDVPVKIYDNILFADNNYRRKGVLPWGEPVDGTYQRLLNGVVDGNGNDEDDDACDPDKGTAHEQVHTYYHGTIDSNAECVDKVLIQDGQDGWYKPQFLNRETGYYFSRIKGGDRYSLDTSGDKNINDPKDGLHYRLSGVNNHRAPLQVLSDAWSNATFKPFENKQDYNLKVGQPVNFTYYFQDADSDLYITFALDNDTNPFNNVDNSCYEEISERIEQKQRYTISAETNFNLWIPTHDDEGSHYVQIKAEDDVGHVRYDYLLQPIHVAPADQSPSDLVVENLSVTPDSGEPGSKATISFTIRNNSNNNRDIAYSSRTNIRLSASSSNFAVNDALLASIEIPKITKGAPYQVSQDVVIPGVGASGIYYVWVILDVNKEANQGGNTYNDKANQPFVVTVPAPPSAIGDFVQVYNAGTSGLRVRSPNACDDPHLIGKNRFDDAVGKVIDGPQTCTFKEIKYTMWKIQWDDCLIGWSAQNWLKKIPSATISCDLTPTITTNSPLPDGMVGFEYSRTLQAVGGITPYSWAVESGSLPPGLNLNSSTGAISGNSTTDGTYSFRIRVTGSNSLYSEKDFSLTIKPAPVIIRTLTVASSNPGSGVNVTVEVDNNQSSGTTPFSRIFYEGTTVKSVTTRIAGGLISPKRALLLAPLKGLLYNFS